MIRASIGGQLNYALLAQQHRPQTNEALKLEVKRLAGTGLKPIDIATSLQLPLVTVTEWVGEQ